MGIRTKAIAAGVCALALVAGAAVGATAYTRSTLQAGESSESVARARRLLARIDKVEAEMHSEAAQTDTFTELEARHEQATQVTCNVTQIHLQEIHRLEMAQQEKRKQRSTRHTRTVADARPPRASLGRNAVALR